MRPRSSRSARSQLLVGGVVVTLLVVLVFALASVAFADQTVKRAYAPYTAGPCVAEVRYVSPVEAVGEPYAPYTAGPVVAEEKAYAPYTAGPCVAEVRPVPPGTPY